MSLRIPALFLLLLLSSWNVFAITDEEIFRSFEFSLINPGARSGAMGGAFIGLADDATAAEANPAGLTILTKPEVSLEYRHSEFDNDELNSLDVISPPGIDFVVLTSNELEKQDQPSFLSVVFPAGNYTFGFSRQEAQKTDALIVESVATVIAGQSAIFTSGGSNSQDIVNWNFALGVKLSEAFSLGATVRYSQLDWQATVVNLVDVPDLGIFDVLARDSEIDDSDSGWGFNIGGLWKGQYASVGAVYKRNPKFSVVETERSLFFSSLNGSFDNVLKVPDTFGAGFAIKPADTMTLTADVVYIKYSDLTEDFQAGHSIFTIGYTNEDISFKVDDGWDFRVGSEFVVFLGNVPVALRAGYYRKAANSLVIDSVAGALPLDQQILPAVFTEREDTNHFTFGNGFVFGPHFQLDWAMDVSDFDDQFVLSSVVRF
jgi:long-subunit fatty acid transport protein